MAPLTTPSVIFGKMFQILIMSGDNAECALFIETFQHSFSYGSSNLWFCTSAEFINEDKAAFVTAFIIVFMLVRCEE